ACAAGGAELSAGGAADEAPLRQQHVEHRSTLAPYAAVVAPRRGRAGKLRASRDHTRPPRI
ncbi:MAG TPA: hypothetical protein VII51_10835, partial [Gaiellaceae bacterium]